MRERIPRETYERGKVVDALETDSQATAIEYQAVREDIAADQAYVDTYRHALKRVGEELPYLRERGVHPAAASASGKRSSGFR